MLYLLHYLFYLYFFLQKLGTTNQNIYQPDPHAVVSLRTHQQTMTGAAKFFGYVSKNRL
jgi:hypothetical protein